MWQKIWKSIVLKEVVRSWIAISIAQLFSNTTVCIREAEFTAQFMLDPLSTGSVGLGIISRLLICQNISLMVIRFWLLVHFDSVGIHTFWMDKCVFCGWSRRAAYPAVRFFGIPKEPGMKRVQWLHAIGNREFTNKDRVCSIHFRSGRPSSDPSHEDFVPHLYLNREAPPEMIHYLDHLVDNKIDDYLESDYKTSVLSSSHLPPMLEYSRACRPKILKRKHRSSSLAGPSKMEAKAETCEDVSQNAPVIPSNVASNSAAANGVIGRPVVVNLPSSSGQVKRVKLQLLQRPLAEAAGIKPGQTVIIKRRVPVLKSTLQRIEIKNEISSVSGENILVAEEQTV